MKKFLSISSASKAFINLTKSNLFSSLPLVWVLAFSFTIPTYIIFFIGKEPFMQGIAFLLYLVPFFIIFVHYKISNISSNFILLWLLFIFFWIAPSINNLLSGRLESELVSMPVLFYHVIVLSAVVIFFYLYCQKIKIINADSLMRSMFCVLLPMILLIFFKTLYLEYQSNQRPYPFDVNPNICAEIIFTFLLVSLRLKSNFVKTFAIILSITCFYLLESRGGLISCYIALFISYCVPWLIINLKKKFILIILVSALIVIFAFFEETLSFFKGLIMLDSRTSFIAGRSQVWELSIKLIADNPFNGIGFWVHPIGYSIPENFPPWSTVGHDALVIHNAFLRIATENGLLLFTMVLFFIILACWRLFKKKSFKDLALIISISFFLFFSTRHLTLNLLNILLYYVLIRTLTVKKEPNK